MIMKDCVFCKIIKGEIPCFKLYEDRDFIAMLDAFPATKGQSLVIPKKHVEYIFDLDESTYIKLLSITREIAKAIDSALDTERTCIVVEGFQVPHTHVRLHPAYEKRLVLHPKDPLPSEEDFRKVADKIKDKLSLF